MLIQYANRAVLTYNTVAYSPREGYRCAFNGSKGRLEIAVTEGNYSAGGEPIATTNLTSLEKNYIQGGVESTQIVVYPLFAEPYVVDVQKSAGGHGGGDPLLLEDVLVGKKGDEFGRAAFLKAGGDAVLVGVGANKSMETGLPVRVQELVKW